MHIKTYGHLKIAKIFLRITIFVAIGFIGFYFSYKGFLTAENSKLLLSKINIDQNIEFANVQVKSLSQSLIIKNSLRFATKDVLTSTASYVLIETKDLSYIEFTSDLKGFKTKVTNKLISSPSDFNIQLNAEIIDASKSIGSLQASIDLGFLLNRMSVSKDFKATLSTTSSGSLLEICSINPLAKTNYLYCHEFTKAYFIKQVAPNAVTYLIALLLCAFLLYNFYSKIIKKLTSKEKEVHAYEQIAHDIKSPITALAIISEAKDLDSRAQPLLKTSVARLKEIVNSNAKASSIAETNNEVDIHQLITEIINEKQTIRKDISIHFSSSAKNAVTAIDSVELKRIVSNLINNSIDATTSNKCIEVSLDEDRNGLKLQVKDYGKGIPEHLLKKVFDRKFTYDKPKGTGLGLYHAKEFITKWNGSIQIESTEGVGTTITVRLPLLKSKLKA
jgi:two-component sensor histidine kinase